MYNMLDVGLNYHSLSCQQWLLNESSLRAFKAFKVCTMCKENGIAFYFSKINSIFISISIRPYRITDDWRWKFTSIQGNVFKHKQQCSMLYNYKLRNGGHKKKQYLSFSCWKMKNSWISIIFFWKPNGERREALYIEMANGKRLCHHRQSTICHMYDVR